jgi:Ca2+-binding RTX toxin-like protein
VTTVLVGTATNNIFSVSGLAKVTDASKLPCETTWCTADGYYITATGTDLGLSATGTYSGTAKDLRISDSTGTVVLELRGANVPLFPLTSGFNTASFMGGDDTLVLSRSSGLVELDGGAGSDTADFSALSGYTQHVGGTKTLTGAEIDLKADTAFLKFVSGHFTWTHAFKLLNIENVIGTQYDDTIGGDDEDNSLSGLDGNDSINGYGGNDVIDGGDGDDEIFGGDGNDFAGGNGGNDEVYGGAGCDTVAGGGGNDYVWGDDGDDVVLGDDGDDVVDGGTGNDKVYGGAGCDTVAGGAGNDYLWGDDGDDVVLGGDGDDVADGGAGNDTMYGGNGNDHFGGNGGNDKVYGGAGNDTVVGGAGNDCLSGEAGNDAILGDDGDDVAFGGDGLDKLFGGNGDDDLYGNAGNDYLSGGTGSDFLTGGTGRDTLIGGAGCDFFNYDNLSEVGYGGTRDWIYDFTRGQDKIGLADIDANTKLAGNQAFSFAGYGGSFSSKGGELKYFFYDVAGTAYDKTIVQGDVNGDCKVDFQIELQGLKTLYASDFIL